MPTDAFVELTEAAVRSRLERMTAHLDHWGTVQALDVGRRTPRRLLELRLDGPGDGMPTEVAALYREYFRVGRGGNWQLVKYTYEYLDLVRSMRLAYHMHPISSSRAVPHAHCERAVDLPEEERSAHLRAVELDLLEAHHEFMRLWASETAPDCDAFLPLAVHRDS
jgi:hypothetical protein